ncbi:MAG: DEAD/DEAH box helicase domain protein [Candidatus Magasanikbacteria bacterium GW2011_GWA2_37_8]|uniref:DEAD/DEAH box helicase domain protein n=1 Tax=Candidatus Magasanikbacteria bacterium GW2011_GWA2_37_8 TaxID=1619036 RepID=A0A0G0HME8_9BACT|nr:MAG: DEAD/DEAH box helicase domain protein [Candidatus Magasanikbacteria bacterium GW2011_GWA2_37_8]
MPYEVVFDIETQNSFADVSNDFKKLKVSVVSLYRSDTNTYHSFTESELSQFWPILEKADRIIGYNSEHFDLPVLNNYYLGDLQTLPHLDIMKIVKEQLGFRLKLADLAAATLDDVNKSADGLQAIKWWKEGKIDEIKKYCEQDVKVTKDIYDFGRENKQLFYKTLTGEVTPFAVNFEPSVTPTTASTINLTLPF